MHRCNRQVLDSEAFTVRYSGSVLSVSEAMRGTRHAKYNIEKVVSDDDKLERVVSADDELFAIQCSVC